MNENKQLNVNGAMWMASIDYITRVYHLAEYFTKHQNIRSIKKKNMSLQRKRSGLFTCGDKK